MVTVEGPASLDGVLVVAGELALEILDEIELSPPLVELGPIDGEDGKAGTILEPLDSLGIGGICPYPSKDADEDADDKVVSLPPPVEVV